MPAPISAGATTSIQTSRIRGLDVVQKPAAPVVSSDVFTPVSADEALRGKGTFGQRLLENAVSTPLKHAVQGLGSGLAIHGFEKPQLSGLDAYLVKVPGPLGPRLRLNIQGPQIWAMSHVDEPGDALNTSLVLRAAPKLLDGRPMTPHVLMRSPRSFIENAILGGLAGQFFTFVHTDRTRSGNETPEQIAAIAKMNVDKLNHNAAPALRRGAQVLIFPEGTVAGNGRTAVTKTGALRAFSSVRTGNEVAKTPVAFGALTYDTISYKRSQPFYNFAPPVTINGDSKDLALATQNKLASLKTISIPKILGGYLYATGGSSLSPVRAQALVSGVVERIVASAPHLAVDMNLLEAGSRAARVTYAHKTLVKKKFIDAQTSAVSGIGTPSPLDAKPLPVRERATRQHVRNPLGFGGNGILQQAQVVPELRAILSEVYGEVIRRSDAELA